MFVLLGGRHLVTYSRLSVLRPLSHHRCGRWLSTRGYASGFVEVPSMVASQLLKASGMVRGVFFFWFWFSFSSSLLILEYFKFLFVIFL